MTQAPDKPLQFNSAQLAGYSSVVGQPIMLLDEAGRCVGQLSLIGCEGDYKATVAQVAEALSAPDRHAYKVGVSVGRAKERALHELADADRGVLE